MYSRKEQADTLHAFWTAIGLYMKPVPPAGWDKVNWINYRTGLKHLYFRMDAARKQASVSIEMTDPISERRALLYRTFLLLKEDLEQITGSGWHWEQEAFNEFGQPMSRIYQEIPGVDVMNQADWPELIRFFKDQMTRLDAFWHLHRDFFEATLNS